MEKLRSIGSHLVPSSSSTSKFTNAFKFNSDHNVLRRNETFNRGNPFLDGPVLEEPSISKTHMIIHIVSIFFTFLAICTMGAVAGFQAQWFAVSGGTGFVLFLLLASILLSIFVLVVPLVYDRWDKLKRPAQFLRQTRAVLILQIFGTSMILLSAFIVTISAWTEAGCKDSNDDPHAGLGDTYKSGLSQWCQTKKASGVFDWFAFVAWSALLILTALRFRQERRHEPSFIPPPSPRAGANTGVSYSGILAADDERYADKQRQPSPSILPPPVQSGIYNQNTYTSPTSGYGHNRNESYDHTVEHGGRASVDPYGAFDGDSMPAGGGASRTMQLAYDDPYAQIRAELSNPQSGSAGGYAQGGLPPPPGYGYR